MAIMNKHKINYTGPLVAFFLSLTLSVAEAGDNDSAKAKELINEMSQAMRSLNYEGIFIYRNSKTINTMRLIHKSDEDGEHQRLISLTGAAREVIRNADSVICIFPDEHSVMVEKDYSKQLVLKLPRPIETISSVYKFSTSGTDRVAGRESWIVNIVPRDEYRYGYRLWIDQDSHILLRSDLRKGNNEILEQVLFTQLEIHDTIPDERLKPSLTGEDYTWYENSPDNQANGSADKGWRVTWMPEGFDMQAHQAQTTSLSRGSIEHLIYTDGIANVSVFIEKMEQDDSGSIGAWSMGGVNTFARLKNGYRITAIGEVPRSTVEEMVKSVVAGSPGTPD